MLSRALQKANDAVLLDNAENNACAVEAYGEACELLRQVMERSAADEERRKLETIVRHSHPSLISRRHLSNDRRSATLTGVGS